MTEVYTSEAGLAPPEAEPYGFRRLLNAVKDEVPVERLADDLGAQIKGTRGLCPIHRGDNRSAFSITPAAGLWYCHRCGEGGDVLTLYEKARGYSDRKLALIELAAEYGIEAPPRPPAWFAKQARQRTVRDAIDDEKVEHVRRLLFRVVWTPWLKTLPEWVRQEAAESAWAESRPMALRIYERRRGHEQ